MYVFQVHTYDKLDFSFLDTTTGCKNLFAIKIFVKNSEFPSASLCCNVPVSLFFAKMKLLNVEAAIIFAGLVLIGDVDCFNVNSGASTKKMPLTSTTALHASVGGIFKRAKDSLLNKERSRKDLKIGIAGFYDRSSELWEEVWGEHMHHGYYVPEDRTDHQQAQIDMIDEVLKWSEVDPANPPKSVVDVGCGIGGSSRHIAKKYNCKTQGITLSPYQANRGNELAEEQGLKDTCNFQVCIFLSLYTVIIYP